MVGVRMKAEPYHDSKYGNVARVAEEFKRPMAVRGNEVSIHHISDDSPKDMPPADL
jgi:hypothetical protein